MKYGIIVPRDLFFMVLGAIVWSFLCWLYFYIKDNRKNKKR